MLATFMPTRTLAPIQTGSSLSMPKASGVLSLKPYISHYLHMTQWLQSCKWTPRSNLPPLWSFSWVSLSTWTQLFPEHITLHSSCGFSPSVPFFLCSCLKNRAQKLNAKIIDFSVRQNWVQILAQLLAHHVILDMWLSSLTFSFLLY